MSELNRKAEELTKSKLDDTEKEKDRKTNVRDVKMEEKERNTNRQKKIDAKEAKEEDQLQRKKENKKVIKGGVVKAQPWSSLAARDEGASSTSLRV